MKMKNGSILALCAALVLALAGCGGSSAPGAPSAPSAPSAAPAPSAPAASAGSSAYAFTLKGVKIAANAEMAPVAEALGAPTDYFESESCAFQGLDKVYTYGGVIITTYPQDGVDYVSKIDLWDDTAATAEGVSIGASEEDVTAAYGAPTRENEGTLIYEDGDCTLAFVLDGGKVSAITYTAIVP